LYFNNAADSDPVKYVWYEKSQNNVVINRFEIVRECDKQTEAGAFLAAAVWGGQQGGQICIWGGKNSEIRMT